MGPDKTISINGAGIAGLTLALALAKLGFRVVIAEQSREISQFGAGLQVSPNARRVLNELGLNEVIAAHSFEPAGIDIYRHGKSAPLSKVTLGQFSKERYAGTPYAVMHRADLAEQLYKATKAFPNIEILFGVTQTRVEDLGDGVSVIIEREGKASYPPNRQRQVDLANPCGQCPTPRICKGKPHRPAASKTKRSPPVHHD